MRESFLKLNDRTVVLSGPMNQTSTTLVTVLSERGCDVGLVSDSPINEQHRFCENITDAREIHSNFGRAAAIPSNMSTEQECSEAISRVAETFGSIEIVIDTNLLTQKDTEGDFQQKMARTLATCNAAVPFLEGRTKGRILFLTNELLFQNNKEAFADLLARMAEFSKKSIQSNISMNGICTGFTEDMLRVLFPETTAEKGLQELQKTYPESRLIEPVEIAYFVTFLSSPISSGLGNQVLFLNAGGTLEPSEKKASV